MKLPISTALLENNKYFMCIYLYMHREKLQSHEFDFKSSIALENILN